MMGLSESLAKEDGEALFGTQASFPEEEKPAKDSRREEIIVLFQRLWRLTQLEAREKQEKTLLLEDAKKAKKRKEELHAGKEIAGRNNMRRKRHLIATRKRGRS